MRLNPEQVRAYAERGFIGPFDGLNSEEVAYFRDELEAFEKREGRLLSSMSNQVRAKTHLLFPWTYDLIRLPVVLDAVESLIGPNILVYHLSRAGSRNRETRPTFPGIKMAPIFFSSQPNTLRCGSRFRIPRR